MRNAEVSLRPLLDHLAAHPSITRWPWRGWMLAPGDGGQNNRLYHATGHGHDLAIKFTIRDARHRAEREYSALSALAACGLDLAPHPVLLDTAYPQPVVVQRWLPGQRLPAPPPDDAMWTSLLAYLAALHALSPDRSPVPLREAVLTARTSCEARDLVHREVARVPEGHRPAALQALLSRFEALRLPEWPPAAVGLCRVDANTANFLWNGETWRSVDWENSGWGDPAFEIADLLTHPAYLGVPEERRAWLVNTYAALVGDPDLAVRINVYRKVMLVWWVARFNRYLYDAPRGRDKRLIARPPKWEDEIKAKYRRYLARAVRAMSGE